MTNGERIMSMMPNEMFTEHTYPQLGKSNRYIELVVDKEWWNAEYKESEVTNEKD